MKINILSTAFAAILSLAFIGAPITAKAQTAPASAPAKKDKKEKKKSEFTPYKGKISALDATSVTVTTAKGDQKLAIDATTEFKNDNKKATAADFAVGDDVTGSFKTNADGTLTAHSVHKKAAAAKK